MFKQVPFFSGTSSGIYNQDQHYDVHRVESPSFIAYSNQTVLKNHYIVGNLLRRCFLNIKILTSSSLGSIFIYRPYLYTYAHIAHLTYYYSNLRSIVIYAPCPHNLHFLGLIQDDYYYQNVLKNSQWNITFQSNQNTNILFSIWFNYAKITLVAFLNLAAILFTLNFSNKPTFYYQWLSYLPKLFCVSINEWKTNL